MIFDLAELMAEFRRVFRKAHDRIMDTVHFTDQKARMKEIVRLIGIETARRMRSGESLNDIDSAMLDLFIYIERYREYAGHVFDRSWMLMLSQSVELLQAMIAADPSSMSEDLRHVVQDLMALKMLRIVADRRMPKSWVYISNHASIQSNASAMEKLIPALLAIGLISYDDTNGTGMYDLTQKGKNLLHRIGG